MNRLDVLGTETSRRARERLLALALLCHARGRHELARHIEDGATSGRLDGEMAELLSIAPRLAPVDDLDWLPQGWAVVIGDEDGGYLAYWTVFPERGGSG
jgi:hypothetical protein